MSRKRETRTSRVRYRPAVANLGNADRDRRAQARETKAARADRRASKKRDRQ